MSFVVPQHLPCEQTGCDDETYIDEAYSALHALYRYRPGPTVGKPAFSQDTIAVTETVRIG
ncbi:hypothetical protein V474_15685 [Novosphingobium barchaimii LL02]|uniref:Uncharacterized protein n=1 Tax=Novosphingobium barchaimii LL02 TaxID=1114963 RepID=A0A0J7XYQ0_9SPHN|nr:hypothetical protein V474_15685 [Novosphingobium barchaimii LL02]